MYGRADEFLLARPLPNPICGHRVYCRAVDHIVAEQNNEDIEEQELIVEEGDITQKTSKRQWRRGIILGMLICLGASPAISTQTEIWTLGTFEDFHGGEADALSLF